VTAFYTTMNVEPIPADIGTSGVQSPPSPIVTPQPTVRGLLLGACALALGRGIVATRRLAGDQALADTLLRQAIEQRDAAVARVVELEETLRQRTAERNNAPKQRALRPRWTAVEKDHLASIVKARAGKRPAWKVIAAELDTGRTAASVAAMARRMGLVATKPRSSCVAVAA